MTGAPKRDEAVAIIKELVQGDVAAIRQSAREASTTVSLFQTLTKAVQTVGDKLTAMVRLASRASDPDSTRVQLEQIQKEFEQRVGQVNQIARSTDYDHNRIFTADGQSISVPTGDGSNVDIIAKDLTFDATGLDMTADPGAAAWKIATAVEELDEYAKHLRSQASRAAEAAAVIESQLAAAMGVDLRAFSMELARRTAEHAAEQFSADRPGLLEMQANVSADRALRLLADRN
ncbi:MAG: flagellin N-terminal helical domain-containing protein [Planctomycetota bacterium]|jgi:flagellin-like hook-associated protein FlgL